MINKTIISIIVAFNKQRVIGANGQIPWHCPADLAHFKQITMGKPILMGRKTHESIGRPLPGRPNVVISQQHPAIEGCDVYPSLQTAIDAYAHQEELMIIGGGQLYRLALALADRIHYTVIDNDEPGDVTFPPLDATEWQLTHDEAHQADQSNPHDYHFYTVERV